MKLKKYLKKINNLLKRDLRITYSATLIFLALFGGIFYFQTINKSLKTIEIKKPIVVSCQEKKLEYLLNNNERRIKYVVDFSKKNKIDPLFTVAVIFAESSNIARATSRVYARGLMQLMKPTALLLAKAKGDHKLANTIKVNPNVLYNPKINIELGTMFLRQLRNMHRNWKETLHAYNVGPYAFRRWGKRNYLYVNKIMRYYNDWKKLDLSKIHIKYGNYLSRIYKRKFDMIVMR